MREQNQDQRNGKREAYQRAWIAMQQAHVAVPHQIDVKRLVMDKPFGDSCAEHGGCANRDEKKEDMQPPSAGPPGGGSLFIRLKRKRPNPITLLRQLAYCSVCSSLPGLKRTAFPGGIATSAPVRGFRPIPVLRGRTLKMPKPRNSIRSPSDSARFIVSKTVSTAISAFVLVMPVRLTTSLMMSSLIKQPPGNTLQGRCGVRTA